MGSQWAQRGNKNTWEERGFLSLPAEICIYLWHLCGIGSRLVAYAMFVAGYTSKLWILVGIRWILNTIWIKVDAWEISLTNCVAFGGVYLFSFVPISPKRQIDIIT
ncbi:hypothetical protein Anas_11303 [Armadillidium nasatum]|uniref:XK-related protein n=1 Tax=Armadillidium nasatum TaxID=96803 RepID=A0A5N5T556_9CRUS|nr:hypothetical protein Anas_11303 [Armadillidium nasatum]